MTTPIKQETRSETLPANTVKRIWGFVDLLLVNKCRITQAASNDRRHGQPARALVSVGEINPIVAGVGVVRMQHNVEEPALSAVNFRNTADRLRQQLPVVYDSQAPRPLCDQHAAVWQKRDRPWHFESALSYRLQFESALFTLHDLADSGRRVNGVCGFVVSRAFSDVNYESTDLRRVEIIAHGRHTCVRDSVADACGDACIVSSVLPVAVHKTRAGAAIHFGSMTVTAIFGVEFRDVATSTGRVLLC